MSEQNPYEILGVTDNASFEEIQSAKKRICEENQNNSQIVEQVEAAYDSVIMERLRLRQEGKIKVPEKIRFPERGSFDNPTPKATVASKSPSWLQQLMDNPSSGDILIPTGVFIGLVTMSVVGNSPQGSLLPLLMALGFIANIYFLTRKEGKFGRSLLITIIALIGGIGLGSAISASLSSNGLGGVSSEQVSSAITFLFFWFTSCFLR